LRISDHYLEIEKGRYTRPYTNPEDRICKNCRNGVEDEAHFWFDCSYNTGERDKLLSEISKTCPMFNSFNNDEKLYWIMNGTKEIQKAIAKYTHYCFSKRNPK